MCSRGARLHVPICCQSVGNVLLWCWWAPGEALLFAGLPLMQCTDTYGERCVKCDGTACNSCGEDETYYYNDKTKKCEAVSQGCEAGRMCRDASAAGATAREWAACCSGAGGRR